MTPDTNIVAGIPPATTFRKRRTRLATDARLLNLRKDWLQQLPVRIMRFRWWESDFKKSRCLDGDPVRPDNSPWCCIGTSYMPPLPETEDNVEIIP